MESEHPGTEPSTPDAASPNMAGTAPTNSEQASPRSCMPAAFRIARARPLLLLVLIAVLVAGSTHRTGPKSAAGPAALPSSKTPTGPLAALVDGLPVTMAAYQRQLRFATNGYSGPRAAPNSPTGATIRRLQRDRAVQQAIAEALIDHVATQYDLVVGPNAISGQIGQMIRQAGGLAALRAEMRAASMTMDDLRDEARHEVLRDQLGIRLHDPAWLDHMVAHATIVYFVGDGAVAPDQAPVMSLSHPAPPFVAVDLKGHAVSLADLRGRPVVLHFWATTCDYCVSAMPMLLRFAKAHPGIAVVALDRREDPDVVRRYIHAHQLQGLTVWLDSSGQAAGDYTVSSLPVTFFIDYRGILRGYNFGPLADAASLDDQASFAVRGLDDTTYNQAR